MLFLLLRHENNSYHHGSMFAVRDRRHRTNGARVATDVALSLRSRAIDAEGNSLPR